MGLSSLSPSCAAFMLESDRAESVSLESWNMVSKADLSFVSTERCTCTRGGQLAISLWITDRSFDSVGEM